MELFVSPNAADPIIAHEETYTGLHLEQIL